MVVRTFILVLTLATLLLNPIMVLGEDVSQDNSEVFVKTENVSNVIDRLKEKITLFFKFSDQDKVNYQKELVKKRLGELEYVIRSKQGDFVEETSSRYSTYVGNFSNLLIEKKISDEKDSARAMLESQIKVLEKLRDNFEFNSGLWMLVEHDINTNKIFSDKLKSI